MAETQAAQQYTVTAKNALCGSTLGLANYFDLEQNDFENIKTGAFQDDGSMTSRLLAPTVHDLGSTGAFNITAAVNTAEVVTTFTLPTVNYPTNVIIYGEIFLDFVVNYAAIESATISIRQGGLVTSPVIGTGFAENKPVSATGRYYKDKDIIRTASWAAGATREITITAERSSTSASPQLFVQDFFAIDYHQ